MEYDNDLEKIIDRVLEKPRDFYVKIYDSLTPVEREILKALIENKSCMNCTNGSCRVEYYEKTNDDTSCVGWENSELIGMQRVLGKNK